MQRQACWASWQTNFTWFRAFCETTWDLKTNGAQMSKQCQKCNISLEAKFCPDCGSKTVDKPSGSHCISCGHANIPNFKVCISHFLYFAFIYSQFCANCGQKSGGSSSAPSNRVEYSEPSFRPSAGNYASFFLSFESRCYCCVSIIVSWQLVKQGAVQTSGVQEFQGRLRYAWVWWIINYYFVAHW